MVMTPRIYRAAVRLAHMAVPLAAGFNPKLARGHAGRRTSLDVFRSWARSGRDRTRPLVWLHASSVGEALQAQPVLQILRDTHPEWQFVHTFFSPSAEGLADTIPADLSAYLPYDTPDAVEAALHALDPQVLVYSRGDLWPELATRARARGTRVGIIGASIRTRSSRSRWPIRRVTRAGYEVVQAAGAIAQADATRLATLGVPEDHIEILGDPRYDSVMQRVETTAPEDSLLGVAAGLPTLVAGSTWPSDERVLLSAFTNVRSAHPSARLIVAPHEPTEANLTSLATLAARLGHPAVRSSEAPPPLPPLNPNQNWRVMIVDRLGVLATLYGAGSLCYVGGGFGRAGLHSVIEPAAWGKPVLFGPRWSENRDARLLIRAGAAADLPSEQAFAVQRLGVYWLNWIENEKAREDAGRRGLEVVQGELGAAARCAALVERLAGAWKA